METFNSLHVKIAPNKLEEEWTKREQGLQGLCECHHCALRSSIAGFTFTQMQNFCTNLTLEYKLRCGYEVITIM